MVLVFALVMPPSATPQGPPPSVERPAAAASPEAAFTIELLETRVRFEFDGTGSREVYTVIRLHSEQGARQFSRLAFSYNRGSEQLEIPTVRIEHASGGSMEMLASAIGDRPVATAAEAPAYQDVREKFVRVAGLKPGDRLEYRVLTKFTHPPLAPEFFYSHSFSREAAVQQELLEIDLPAARSIQMRISPSAPASSTEKTGEGPGARIIYRWKPASPGDLAREPRPNEAAPASPDVALSTFSSWQGLAERLSGLLGPPKTASPDIAAKARAVTAGASTSAGRLEGLYSFVGQKIRIVDLPLGTTGFQTRRPSEILSSGYATPEDKFVLFAALAEAAGFRARAVLCNALWQPDEQQPPMPSFFNHLVIFTGTRSASFWLDPSVEIAPFRVISASLRGKRGLLLGSAGGRPGASDLWPTIPLELPFPAMQQVRAQGSISAAGKLSARVRYVLRGDNELVLRLAFHSAPRQQWKALAQLVALSDGYGGQVSDVAAADPLATRQPFRIEYALAQPSFVDLAKPSARVSIPLPVVSLPELPAKETSKPIVLGTPLEIATQLRLRLPPGFGVRVPVPMRVRRDYAEFSSSYALRGAVFVASRHLKFLQRELEPGRAADYAAFVRAVQTDEAQELTLERPSQAHPSGAPSAKPH